MKRKLLTLFAAIATAMVLSAPAQANDWGQCNTNDRRFASSINIFISNLRAEGVFSQAANYARRNSGYRPARDGSYARFLRKHGVIRPLPRGVSVRNHGCRGGVMFGAGTKWLPAGRKVVVITPARYWNKKFRFSRPANTAGWRRVRPWFQIVGQTDCSNPSGGKVRITIWVRIPDQPIRLVKNAEDWRGNPLEATDPRVAPGTFSFVFRNGGKAWRLSYGAQIGTRVVAGKCRVGSVVRVSEIALEGWIITSQNPQEARCGRRGVTFTFVNQLCPPEIPVVLKKRAKKAGKEVRVRGGVFRFEVFVDGESRGLVANRGGGRLKHLFKVNPDQQVRVCEKKEPRGTFWFRYRPKAWCSRLRTAVDRPLVFSFTNNCAKRFVNSKTNQCRRR